MVAGEGSETEPRLEDLIWHPSDSAVLPIVANRRIESVADPQFDAAALPFPPLVRPSVSILAFCYPCRHTPALAW